MVAVTEDNTHGQAHRSPKGSCYWRDLRSQEECNTEKQAYLLHQAELKQYKETAILILRRKPSNKIKDGMRLERTQEFHVNLEACMRRMDLCLQES